MRQNPARPEQPQLPPLVTRDEEFEVFGVKLHIAAGQPVRKALEGAVVLLGLIDALTVEIIGGLGNDAHVNDFVAAIEALAAVARETVQACTLPLMAVEKYVENVEESA